MYSTVIRIFGRKQLKPSEYFDAKKGYGVIATADKNGELNTAIYARPHFIDEQTIAFIMREKKTYSNLSENPSAAYLFIESGGGYSGKRLYLTKIKEQDDDALIAEICRRCDYTMFSQQLSRHVVFFRINKVLPLVGSGSETSA